MTAPINRRSFSAMTLGATVALATRCPAFAISKEDRMTLTRHFVVDPITGLKVAVSRALPSSRRSAIPVIYVHGGTFPSELAVGYRFDGRSWRDELLQSGHEVWAFDFLGFGASDRYPAMSASPFGVPPLGRALGAASQLAAVASLVREVSGVTRLNLIAHSWGTMVTGLFASEHADQVERIVFFAPIVRRQPVAPVGDAPFPAGNLTAGAQLPAWMPMTLAAQHKRFIEDVPPGHPAVLSEGHFAGWGQDYLATDPIGRLETPPSVHIPLGPGADVAAAWQGLLPYDPHAIKSPLKIVRGEWDSLSTDADAAWLMRMLGSVIKDDAKLPAGTHLMHLEEGRTRLYAAANSWFMA